MEYETIKGYLLLNKFNFSESSMYYVLQNNYIVFVFDSIDSITKNLLEVQYYYDEDMYIWEYQNSLFKITYERYPFYTIIFEPLKAYSYFLDKGSIVLTDEKSTIELPLDKNKFLEFIRNI